ncbi:hypothetical protein MKW98_020275 [Papaver atlanticum]|uniref:Transposase Tnp1/En/Spm-like domain-containing protein n=1 Tax=Papaver atlanticum TaxID=357466 RepID=A0AAD4XVZ2_9MAGN|nr:hypothetical protein MKW98_020275 [Papaver atlanticum]
MHHFQSYGRGYGGRSTIFGGLASVREIYSLSVTKLEIHGMPIGFGPTSEFKYVGDAVGSIISWPKDRIVFS